MKDSPFSISPNPANLYLTPSLKAILHKMRYVIEKRRGLTCLLGDVGMGKSSIIRLLYAEYSAKEDYSVCLIPTPAYTSDFGLLKGICSEFNIALRKSMNDQQKEMTHFLTKQYQQDRNVVVFIDESQRLDNKMLEQIRAMLNFESDEAKLIQIIMSGQIELRDKLLDKSKKALRSRIFAPSTLDALTLGETKAMIEYRCEREEIPCPVPDFMFETIYNLTGGVPREVLKLCDVAYELMRVSGEKTFSPEIIKSAIEETEL
jgi:general secretion pathway protein A